jgi:hypothetical protein
VITLLCTSFHKLQMFLRTRRNVYRIHHTGGEPSYLLRLRDIYVELAALRSFAELNKVKRKPFPKVDSHLLTFIFISHLFTDRIL